MLQLLLKVIWESGIQVIKNEFEDIIQKDISNYSDIELALPTSKAQKLVHLADFLSSKKVLDIKFNGNEINRD